MAYYIRRFTVGLAPKHTTARRYASVI